MAAAKSTGNTTTIPTRAWFGDDDLQLTFPDGWRVTTLWPKDAPAASQEEIASAFANPIGSRRIAELAAGKQSAGIIVDDLSRPTPAAELMPQVLSELNEAGVPDDGIRIVIGTGSHRPLTREEIEKKLGAEVASKYDVSCHDCYAGDLVGYGKMADGTPLYFNRKIAESDLKIALGGIYPHGAVGFGGGAKLVLPGVSGFATMFHFHTFYASRGHGVVERKDGPPDHRDAAETAAKALELDIIVNAVINSRRKIAGVFVGDYIEAHHAGARFAFETYSTEIPADLCDSTDIVITNVYPLDSDPIQTAKAVWMRNSFKNSYLVAINPASDGIFFHGLFDRIDWQRFSEMLSKREQEDDPAPEINGTESPIMWSKNFPIQDFKKKIKGGVLFREWNRLIDQLAVKVPSDARVAVFPCGGIQVPM